MAVPLLAGVLNTPQLQNGMDGRFAEVGGKVLEKSGFLVARVVAAMTKSSFPRVSSGTPPL